MKTNVVKRPVPVTNNQGGPAVNKGPEDSLMRTVGACMLWEDGFYEDGVTVADRIKTLVPQCRPEFVAATAVYARSTMQLRHAPLLVVREMVRHPEHKKLVGRLLPDVIQRPDEIAEFLAIYWKDEPDAPIAKQVKIGLGSAFKKFSAMQLSKWDKPGGVRLRDVMFLVHAKPSDASGVTKEMRKAYRTDTGSVDLKPGERLYHDLVNGLLPSAQTWEERLSAGADPKATWEAMMLGNELGGLAFIRNLRNMEKVGVDKAIIREYAKVANVARILPYRFLAAARMVPSMEDVLEPMMFRALADKPKIGGKTAVLLDISGSMSAKLSTKSDLSRKDAALGLGILCREMFEDCTVFSVSNDCVQVPPRRGFASGTWLGKAVAKVNAQGFDRVIMLTDEESSDKVPDARADKAYIINVASSKHGVGRGKWLTITGFSEAVLDYIVMTEQQQ
jgi:hypothetical protein